MSYTILTDCPLRTYNTFGINAVAARLVTYDTPSDLPAIFADDAVRNHRFLHIGHGSNLLFTSDYDGTILMASTFEFDAAPQGNGRVAVRCSAGISFDDFVACTCAAGLYGAENLSLIPGTVGAAAVQNIGAYGTEAADIISTVETYDVENHCQRIFQADECAYGYRNSIFKDQNMRGRYIVTAVTMMLSRTSGPKLDYGALRPLAERGGTVPTPDEVRQEVIAIRKAKLPDPAEIGSAGSYFKNPVLSPERYDNLCQCASELFGPDAIPPRYVMQDGTIKTSAAWLIDRCGWKGYRHNHAGVWHKQPLVLINADGQATASDILALERMITDDIANRLGISLSTEVEKVGKQY